eukprot:4425630-Pyramimonas_sp.AAC.1
MTSTGEVDLHSDSGYRRLRGDVEDEARGHGVRGQTCYGVDARLLVSPSSMLSTRAASPAACRSARATQRKHLAATCNLEDCYLTIVTLHELHAGPLTPTQL